jgi:pimeloyl-ACP methyl ester carboxylesterase
MKSKFVNPRLEHLPDSGHYIAEEASEQVAKILQEFLKATDSK